MVAQLQSFGGYDWRRFDWFSSALGSFKVLPFLLTGVGIVRKQAAFACMPLTSSQKCLSGLHSQRILLSV